MSVIDITKLTPAPGYVLVSPTEPQTKTASGIYLPDTTDEKPQDGVIIAVGADGMDDGQKVACPFKKGDQVLYKQWGGNAFKAGGKEYQILKFEDLLAKIA